MNRCRFRDLPGHACARRDGRIIPAGDDTPCWYETRAQVVDESRLAVEVDAAQSAEWVRWKSTPVGQRCLVSVRGLAGEVA
jgi:hypothetical protein